MHSATSADFLYAIPEAQYYPWVSTASFVTSGYLALSHMKVVKSGAECFSRQILPWSLESFQQKFLGLQSKSVSHSEPTSDKGKHTVLNGHMLFGRHAKPLWHWT